MLTSSPSDESLLERTPTRDDSIVPPMTSVDDIQQIDLQAAKVQGSVATILTKWIAAAQKQPLLPRRHLYPCKANQMLGKRHAGCTSGALEAFMAAVIEVLALLDLPAAG